MDIEIKECRHTVVLGVNYATTKTTLRDRLLFPEAILPQALDVLRQRSGVRECVILSTCNRVEVYAVVNDPSISRAGLLDFLADFHQVERSAFEEHSYYHRCDQAAQHLFHVGASLDSLVVGEAQILGQVKEAIRIAMACATTGPILNKLFQYAITAGKRARTETKIGEGAVSISLSAIDLARKVVGKLQNQTAMVIGAGEMGELTAKHLRSGGIKKMYFVNRSLERATALATEFGGTPLSLEHKSRVLAECDIVISSTASPHFVITADELRGVMVQRRNRPLVLIDIAAPRDIDPLAGALYNVFLYSIDDLAIVAHANTQMRAGEVAKVRTILEEEMAGYVGWYRSLSIQPVLVSLRGKFEQIRTDELHRHSSSLNALPAETQSLVNQITTALMNKYLHQPSTALKGLSTDPDAVQHAISLVKLFNLEIPT